MLLLSKGEGGRRSGQFLTTRPYVLDAGSRSRFCLLRAYFETNAYHRQPECGGQFRVPVFLSWSVTDCRLFVMCIADILNSEGKRIYTFTRNE